MVSKKFHKVLHSVNTTSPYTDTKLVDMNGKVFKFVHDIHNGGHTFTIELFNGEKFNFITGLSGLGVQRGVNHDVSYVSNIKDKQELTKMLFNKGINFITLLP